MGRPHSRRMARPDETADYGVSRAWNRIQSVEVGIRFQDERGTRTGAIGGGKSHAGGLAAPYLLLAHCSIFCRQAAASKSAGCGKS